MISILISPDSFSIGALLNDSNVGIVVSDKNGNTVAALNGRSDLQTVIAGNLEVVSSLGPNAKTEIYGPLGSISSSGDKCETSESARALKRKCAGTLHDELSEIKNFQAISQAITKYDDRCGDLHEEVSLYNKPFDKIKIAKNLEQYFVDQRCDKQKKSLELAEVLILLIEKTQNEYRDLVKINASAELKTNVWRQEVVFRSLANPNGAIRFDANFSCGPLPDINPKPIDVSRYELQNWRVFIGAQVDSEHLILTPTHNATAEAKNNLNQTATTNVTAQNAVAVSAPVGASVADIQQAVRSHSPSSSSLVAAYASEATDRALRAISSVSPAALKAIGGNTAALVVASKVARAEGSKFQVTLPKSIDSQARPILAGIAVTGENQAESKTLLATVGIDRVAASESAKAGRKPASLGSRSLNSVDGTPGGLNIASSGGSVVNEVFDKNTKMNNAKVVSNSDKTVVLELMDRAKSTAYLKILESNDERLKPQKAALLARLKKDKIRIFDRNQKPFGYDQKDAAFVFRQRDDYFERLK